ncbi:hypothetical protein GCM10010174_17780 [Kutzneria viridogrisea]|uniref:SAM-dependent methyltransferase n=1 Tax=Kutzneria viridogrisea TaxID=47990 RepID=A0ABR6BD74_9PSEU|nr:SAM-dependent methyltransferase [Kutzneria viridogrisea]
MGRYGWDCLQQAVQQQAARTPHAPAVTCGADQLSYAELNARANQLARHLLASGLGPERVVVLALPRSVELVVALLAVLKSGAASLVAPADQPAEVRPDRVLSELRLDDPGLLAHPDTDLPARVLPRSAAYLVPPEGVVLEHSALVDHLHWARGHPIYGPLTCGDTVRAEELEITGWPVLPGADTRVHVLDERLRPVPVGTEGQLYASGTGLARGYHGRPAATAARFVACPFGAPGERMYRTGNLVRRTAEGGLEFLDGHGLPVDPHEVAAVAAAHPGVTRALVLGSVCHLVPNEVVLGEFAADPPLTEPEQTWEWQDATVARILSLRPRRVLEIGFDGGLVLGRVAPHCESYWGTEVSPEAIARMRAAVAEDSRLASKVELWQQAADEVDGLPAGFFDTVIVNAVAQRFPSGAYLAAVLTKVVALLAPGGAVFVGDLRNPRLLPAEQPELLVDPDFFAALREQVPDVDSVDLRLKRAVHHGELSRCRYDVVLRKHGVDTVSLREVPVLAVSDLGELAEHLELVRPARVRLSGVDNRRLVDDGIDPERLHELAEGLEYWAATTWSARPDRFDAVLVAREHLGPGVFDDLYLPGPHSGRELTSDPMPWRPTGRLLDSVRAHLRRELPEYMVPTTLVVVSG